MDIRDEYKEVYKNERKKINQEFYNKNYNEAIEMSFKLLQELSDKKIYSRYNFWFIYYSLSEAHIKLEMFKEGVKYANMGKKYCDTLWEKAYCDWLLALCYKIHKHDKALKIFDRLISFYSMNNCPYNLGRVLTLKGYLTENEDLIFDSIEIFNNIDIVKMGIEPFEINYSYDIAYEKLALLYIKQNSIFKANSYNKKITDTKMKKNIEEQLRIRVFEPIQLFA